MKPINKTKILYIFNSLFILFIMISLMKRTAYASEYEFKPSVTVSEEYNDNVFETSMNKQSDYITRLLPGLTLNYRAPLWDLSIDYAYDYRYYARRSRTDDTTHNLVAKGLVKIIDEFLFLDVNDTYQRVSLDVTRDTTNESLFVNQSDQNTAIVSPYIVLHPSTSINVQTGYRYSNVWYKDPRAISKQAHTAFLDASYEMSPKFFITSGYKFTREESFAGYYRHDAYVGPRFEYADKSFVFAQGGATWTGYDNRMTTRNPYWNGGITHTFDTTTATLTTSLNYTEDPLSNVTRETVYALLIQKNLPRGMISLSSSYADFFNTFLNIKTTERYNVGIKANYEIANDINGLIGFTYEHYNNLLLDTYTRKYFVDSGITNSFGHGWSMGLNYKYIDYYSPIIATDNKQVNRISLDVKKVF